MDEEIKLDSSTIEMHYGQLISGATDCDDPYEGVSDDETNIIVKDNMNIAYGSALLVEKSIAECLSADAEHLDKLGQTFLTVDSKISTDIDELLTFKEK